MFISTIKKAFDPSSIDPNQKASYPTVKLCAYKLTEAYNRATDLAIDYGTAFKWVTSTHPHTDPKKNLKHGQAQIYIDSGFKMPKKMITQLEKIHATKKPAKTKKPSKLEADQATQIAEMQAQLALLLKGAK